LLDFGGAGGGGGGDNNDDDDDYSDSDKTRDSNHHPSAFELSSSLSLSFK
jgi:hypothetical protein